MDLKSPTSGTPKGKLSCSRYGRKITPKKQIGSDEDTDDLKKSPTKATRKCELIKKNRTPKKDEVNSSEDPELNVPPKTPYSLRLRIKSRIQDEIEKEEETAFSLSEESDWDDSESESESDDEEEEVVDSPLPCLPKYVKSKFPVNRKSDYVCGSDYLEKTSGKSLTSSKRMKKLDDIKGVAESLSTYISAHDRHINTLQEHYHSLFYKWMYTLSKGYNIIVYGLGSKKSLLENFKTTFLNSCKVLIVNGYFPGLTVKEILSSLFELVGENGKETVEDFFISLKHPKAKRIFLLIHNIDGLALRVDKAQSFLSQLAAHDKVHLVASIDHINAPLLWDQKKLSNFNFIWEDCATYLPYVKENSFESSLMVQSSSNLALSSLRNVFRSLNKNSRTIFKYLLEHSLNPNSKTSGMQFSELYRLCRRNFIVSSDLALRAQLTEFIDHQLVRWRKESDILTVCVEKEVLKTFKLEIEADNV